MATVYQLNQDGTISAVDSREVGNSPWYVAMTAAAVHGGSPVTCFTKEGVRADRFRNPMPDPDVLTDGTAEPERAHYFVQMTHDGDLHLPPLTPAQAASHVPVLPPLPLAVLDYEAENVTPAI